jgi:hypothetical protein
MKMHPIIALSLTICACGASGSDASRDYRADGGDALQNAAGAAVAATGGAGGIGGLQATAGVSAVARASATGGANAAAGRNAGGAVSTGGAAAGKGGAGTGGTAGATGIGGAGGAAGVGGTAGAGGVSYPYIFSTFNDALDGNTSLLIYISKDALNFSLLTDTKYFGASGSLRDPSIMKHSDGKYYVAYTTPPDAGCCGPESSFSLAVSSDLEHWTTLTTVASGIADVKNTWAPEFYADSDGTINLLVNVSTSAAKSFQTYKYTALDSGLKSWSGPVAIHIGPNYIDTFIVKIGSTYHAFTKNETTTYIEHATASNLIGPWTFVGKEDWAGWGAHREGPSLIRRLDGTWCIFVDGYSPQARMMYSESSDNFASWTPLKGLPTIGNSVSHGTVLAN